MRAVIPHKKGRSALVVVSLAIGCGVAVTLLWPGQTGARGGPNDRPLTEQELAELPDWKRRLLEDGPRRYTPFERIHPDSNIDEATHAELVWLHEGASLMDEWPDEVVDRIVADRTRFPLSGLVTDDMTPEASRANTIALKAQDVIHYRLESGAPLSDRARERLIELELGYTRAADPRNRSAAAAFFIQEPFINRPDVLAEMRRLRREETVHNTRLMIRVKVNRLRASEWEGDL